MGHCFLSKDTDSQSLTVLALKDRDSHAIVAHPVLCKGRLRSGSIEQAADSIRRLGHRGRVLLKTDNEPALVDLKEGVADALSRGGGVENLQVTLEHLPAYEPQANGLVENAAGQLTGLVRTLMLALQERIQGEVPARHPAMLWLIEHAGELLTKHTVGHDGRTPF
eukprot:11101138-Alexandrium_andersonii.AAC.1